MEDEKTATDVKNKWRTRQTHHQGRSSASRAAETVRLCSIANVDIALFCACDECDNAKEAEANIHERLLRSMCARVCV